MVELLINYQYPESLYSTFRDQKGELEWRLPFDPNAQDVTGQTALYVACLLGNKGLVELILNWKVKCKKLVDNSEVAKSSTNALERKGGRCENSPTKRRVSYGIQSIMSRLSLGKELEKDDGDDEDEEDGGSGDTKRQEFTVNPLQLDLLCGAARETALQAAVRGGYQDVALLLLTKGADPSVVAKPMEDQSDPK